MKKYDAGLVAKLAKEILDHKKLYYKGNPRISDAEYDQLEEKLFQLDPKHPVLKTVGSGTQLSLSKVKHDVPMLSLSKTYQFDEILSWQKKRSLLGTLKIDGNSLSLIYEKGVLVQAKTRGNGEFGEDVTTKIFWVEDCPRYLEDTCLRPWIQQLPDRIEVRGELFCTDNQFSLLHHEMAELGLDLPSSPRNVVAGILGRKQYVELARFFNFFAFDLVVPDHEALFSSELEKYKALAQSGFVLPDYDVLQSKKSIQSFLDHVQTKMQRGEFGIDGAVFAFNDVLEQKRLGSTAHHPRYKLSFKWQGETATTMITKVSWMTSRLGVVTPVAEIDPVVLSGATITNVTLHNASYVRLFNLKVGDCIEIVRSGEVIPKFLRVIRQGEGDCLIPKACPSCGVKLVSDEVRIRCLNRDCPEQKFRSILNWIRCVGIEDLSEKRLKALMEAGLIESSEDLYRLKIDDFLKLSQTKLKLAEKLYKAIQKSKQLPLSAFLNGLGIAGMGRRSWQLLIAKFGRLELLLQLTEKDIVSVDGFAEKTAEHLVSGLKSKGKMIQELLSLGIQPVVDKAKISQLSEGLFLQGKTVVITGAFSQSRAEFSALIEGFGGKINHSVSKRTDILLIADPNSSSSKAKKARELGVELWSAEVLLAKQKQYQKKKDG